MEKIFEKKKEGKGGKSIGDMRERKYSNDMRQEKHDRE